MYACMACVYVCMNAWMCVCVWNIWTDVKLLPPILRFFTFWTVYLAGGQEPMIVCPDQRRPDNMGVKTYLPFPILCPWHAAKPRTAPPTFFDFMYVCRNLHSLWFHYTGLSFSPFQNSALNYGWASSALVFSPPFAFSFMEFPMITS